MNFSVKTSNPATLATPVIVLGLFDDGTLPPLSAEIDNTTRSALSRIAKAGDIKGKLGDVLLLQRIDGCKAQRILLIGLGKAKELDAKKYATALAKEGFDSPDKLALLDEGDLTACGLGAIVRSDRTPRSFTLCSAMV